MSENIAPKKRGRPLGAVREIYYILSAVKNGYLCEDQIRVERGETLYFDLMKAEAQIIFKNKYNIDAQSIRGPFFEAKLSQPSSGNKKESIHFSEDKITLTNRKIQATINDWEVIGRFFKDDDSDEEIEDVVRITYKRDLGDKKRSKPHDTFKRLSELTDIQEL